MSWRIFGLILMTVSSSYLGPVSAQAGRLAQDDPVAQCAAGVKLFLNGQTDKARPLLEAGFAGRDTAESVNQDDLGLCALALGLLRDGAGNSLDALSAYAIALEAFRASGNRSFEDTTLNNIGFVYSNQGRYAAALEAYQQALAIERTLTTGPARASR